MASIHAPYLLFLGEAGTPGEIKTAQGLVRWRRNDCVGEWWLGNERPRDDETAGEITAGLRAMNPEAAVAAGAKTVVVGCVNAGGLIPESWVRALARALAAGLDVASGMHRRLRDIPELVGTAEHHRRKLHDVRVPPAGIPVGTGAPRSGHRILTVGTDCSVGKMWTSLALTNELRQRDQDATFRATGQTGIFIAGEGMPVDAVVSDFVSGSVEQLAPAAADDHWDCIEGQGSLFHPGFAAVTLGLVHGAQAESLVLCHVAGREQLRATPHPYPIPDLDECVTLYERTARLTNRHAKVVGLSIVTSFGDEPGAETAQRICAEASQRTGLPAVDPTFDGAGALVDAALAHAAHIASSTGP